MNFSSPTKVKKELFGVLFILILNLYFNAEQLVKISNYGEFLQIMILFSISSVIYYLLFSLCYFSYSKISAIILTIILIIFIANASSIYTLHNFNVEINYEFYIDIFGRRFADLVTYSKSIIDPYIFLYLLFYGIIPFSILVYLMIYKRAIVYYYSDHSFLIIVVVIASTYLGASIFYSSNYYLAKQEYFNIITCRFTPINYIVATVKILYRGKDLPKEKRIKICEDAKLTVDKNDKDFKFRTVIFILGESARIDHFSINGYHRNTNPKLSKIPDLITFEDFEACNTTTWRSVPCIFSRLNMREFTLPVTQHNLLDVLEKVGIKLYWISGQTHCVATCSFVENKKLALESDELLLKELEIALKNDKNQPKFIVLHHNGSHIPYHIRYNENHEIFTPVCKEMFFRRLCDIPSIINTYDNTIVATDDFIDSVIKIAKKYDVKNNTVVIYTSDHGQSLGEGGEFTHGAPRLIAPKEQILVPFFIWLPKQTAKKLHINYSDLLYNSQNGKFHHDYIFDSVMKLFNIESSCYGKDGDVFTRKE